MDTPPERHKKVEQIDSWIEVAAAKPTEPAKVRKRYLERARSSRVL